MDQPDQARAEAVELFSVGMGAAKPHGLHKGPVSCSCIVGGNVRLQ